MNLQSSRIVQGLEGEMIPGESRYELWACVCLRAPETFSGSSGSVVAVYRFLVLLKRLQLSTCILYDGWTWSARLYPFSLFSTFYLLPHLLPTHHNERGPYSKTLLQGSAGAPALNMQHARSLRCRERRFDI